MCCVIEREREREHREPATKVEKRGEKKRGERIKKKMGKKREREKKSYFSNFVKNIIFFIFFHKNSI